VLEGVMGGGALEDRSARRGGESGEGRHGVDCGRKAEWWDRSQQPIRGLRTPKGRLVGSSYTGVTEFAPEE
jgi:hypothetical protein